MTRSTRVAHAVTALRKARAADSALSEPVSKTFLVFEDNSGGSHWRIVAGDETLARSATSASYEEAKQAALIRRDGASSASFDEPAARWSDEAGSFNSEAVGKWPASR